MIIPDATGASVQDSKNSVVTRLESSINAIFAQRQKASLWRRIVIRTSFLVIWIIWTLSLYSTDYWGQLMGGFFQEFLAFDRWVQNSPILIITNFSIQTFLHPTVLRHLLILYASFWVAQRITAKYLADIFSTDITVANRFIRQATFGLMGSIKIDDESPGSTFKKKIMNLDANTLRIREGKVIESDCSLSVLQIGGPGYIQVELDSAALIEGPDGSCRVVGPTVESGTEILECFERVRQSVNLRDLIDSQNVSARSRDGIPVNARDIQYSFSIYRGGYAKKSLTTPYPFDPNSVKRLVYRSVRSIDTLQNKQSKPDWQVSLPGKITANVGSELAAFITTKGLGEFLAAIGEPEIKNIINGEISLGNERQQSVGMNEIGTIRSSLEMDVFTPRALITKIFQEGTEFKERLQKKGVQLNWIGVGTWDTPTEIIPANHLEAWKISRENFKRGNPEELEKIQREARLSELLRLVQNIPIRTFFDMNNKSDEEVIGCLLAEYHELLVSARKLFLQDYENIPEELESAISKLNSLRDVHWINE